MASDKVAWFEFLLTPSLLDTHLNEANPVPTPTELLIQFIFHGSKKNEGPITEIPLDVDPVTEAINNKKDHMLTILPLQIAAKLNWKLDVFENSLPLHIQNDLLLNLLIVSLEEQSSPTTHGTLDTGALKPHQLFALSLYHRYALRALVNNKLPSKPLKVSNIVIPGQQDPTLESREVHESIVSRLERNAATSVRILEQLLGAGEVRAPVLQSFTSSLSSKAESGGHHIEKCELVADEQFKCEIHYDLGVYHFTMERYGDAFHHFTEAVNLYPEIWPNTHFCGISEKKLRGYHASCASVCGRKTPVQKRSLYDQFNHSIANNYDGILNILSEDNLAGEIPFYLRQNFYLDLVTFSEKMQGLPIIFQVQTLNTIRCVLHGDIWDSSYILSLLKAGKQGAQYLVEILSSQMRRYTPTHKDRIRNFVITLNVNEGINEILVKPLMSYDASLANLFSHKEFVSMLSNPDEKATKLTKSAFDVSLGAEYTDIGDLTWDIIHSYDPVLLKTAIHHYMTVTTARPDTTKRDIAELNVNWELPIPVHNTMMKLPPTTQRNMLFIFIAKAEEAAVAKSYKCALDLLSEACNILTGSNNKDSIRLSKMINWLILVTKIQRCLDQLPCVEESVMANLTDEAKQCLSCLSGREVVVPWTNIVNWCLLLLVNVQEWQTILNGFSLPPQHFPLLGMIKPLAATAKSLQDKDVNQKVWYNLWETVLSVIVGNNSSNFKRNQNQPPERHLDPGFMTRASFLDIVSNIKEASCLSIIISLLGHYINIPNDEPMYDVHIDHLGMWPASHEEGSSESDMKAVKETLAVLVNQATKLYPAASHTSISLCTSWHLTKADLAYLNKDFQSAIQGYLTAIFVATDYLRNDDSSDQLVNSDMVTKKMIKCCMKLNCYTQAAILCQFLESIDYNTAIRCLQERNSVDAMDAYYNCLWDVTLMEFIINMHQKKGEIQRRDKVLKIIGLLEVNSNNNEEIQREAAKSRKHRFLRALAKQYL